MYQVIENAGQDNERIVDVLNTFTKATLYIEHNYSPDERDALGVDILKADSTEF